MRKKYADKIRKVIFWIRRNVPFGVRSLIGVLLIVGGIFGFLPILGFWMLPLGIVAILIDWRDLRRRRSATKQHRSE